MQGIAALPTDMAPGGQGMGQLSAQEASTLGRLLTKVSQEEIDQLRELSQDLKEFSGPELSDFLGGVDYIMANAQNYKQSVRNLIARGIVEPGDLPADYIPTFFAILRQMIVDTIGEVSAKPQEFAKGGLVAMAKKVKAAGRHGDTMLAHITPREAAMLKAMGGAGTINPATGLPEFKSFWSKVGNFLKKAAPVILPVALSFIPGLGTAVGAAIGGALGVSAGTAASLSGALLGAVGSGVGGLIAGQKPGQALLSAALGGVGGYALSSMGGVSGLLGAGGGEAAAAGAGAGAEAAAGAVAPAGSMTGVTAPAQVGPVAPVNPAVEAVSKYASSFAPNALDNVATSLGSGSAGYAAPTGGLGNLFSGVGNLVSKYPLTSLALAGGAGMLLGGGMGGKEEAPAVAQGPTGADLLAQNPSQYGFNIANFQAQPMGPARMVQPQSPAFPGGYTGQLPGLYAPRYAKAGGHISGPGTGTSDDVPAMLSDGEFVLTAKAVRGAGDGDRMKGAKKLYKLMNSLEKRA